MTLRLVLRLLIAIPVERSNWNQFGKRVARYRLTWACANERETSATERKEFVGRQD